MGSKQALSSHQSAAGKRYWLLAAILLSIATQLWFGSEAAASQPILTYEAAPPGAEPSWILVYADGRVERDLAPYMKNAGHHQAQLTAADLRAVRNLIDRVAEADKAGLYGSNDTATDFGEVTVTIADGGEYRTVRWRAGPEAMADDPLAQSALMDQLLFGEL